MKNCKRMNRLAIEREMAKNDRRINRLLLNQSQLRQALAQIAASAVKTDGIITKEENICSRMMELDA